MSAITNCKEKLNLYLLRIPACLIHMALGFVGNRIFDGWQPSSVSHFLNILFINLSLLFSQIIPQRGHCHITTCISFFSFFHPFFIVHIQSYLCAFWSAECHPSARGLTEGKFSVSSRSSCGPRPSSISPPFSQFSTHVRGMRTP